MFLVMMLSFLCSEPLAIGRTNPDAPVKSASEPAHGTSEAQAANLPLETAKAEADVATGGMVPPGAAPLVANLDRDRKSVV